MAAQTDWEFFIKSESRLPGPRANLELLEAVAQTASREQFLKWLAEDEGSANANTPAEFLVICGVRGLGRLVREGELERLVDLRQFASDPRWRIREAAAMALQSYGDLNLDELFIEMQNWSKGNLLEQRAVVAALCEPRLLKKPEVSLKVLAILDQITAGFSNVENRKSDEFIILRKALGYGWSVAVAANPAGGKHYLEKWSQSTDKDIHWVVKENLGKNRLSRMDPQWVSQLKNNLP